MSLLLHIKKENDVARRINLLYLRSNRLLVTNCKHTKARRKFVDSLGALNFVSRFFPHIFSSWIRWCLVGTRLLNGDRLPRRSRVVLSRCAHVFCVYEAKWDLPTT